MKRRNKIGAAGLMFFAACFVQNSPVSAHQASGNVPMGNSGYFPKGNSAPRDPGPGRLEHEANKARSKERFNRIQTDTARLLELSTELKADVDKSTVNQMSLDVIRKAAEIEKLARDVKDRMKG